VFVLRDAEPLLRSCEHTFYLCLANPVLLRPAEKSPGQSGWTRHDPHPRAGFGIETPNSQGVTRPRMWVVKSLVRGDYLLRALTETNRPVQCPV